MSTLAVQAVQASSRETNVKRATVVKFGSDKGVDKRSDGSTGTGPGNRAKLTELVVTGKTKRVNLGRKGELLIQGDKKVVDR